jgi:hypothetical protein
MISLLDVRFNMKATVLNRWASDEVEENPVAADVVKGGHWMPVQDDETGGIKQMWVEDQVAVTPKPGRTDSTFRSSLNQPGQFNIECVVRGFPEVGFRSSANTENFLDGKYVAIEDLKMSYPARYNLSRRQLITNIRRNDVILWLEEDTGQPTVFEVQGITPTFDPFGRHIDNLTVLKRADVQ